MLLSIKLSSCFIGCISLWFSLREPLIYINSTSNLHHFFRGLVLPTQLREIVVLTAFAHLTCHVLAVFQSGVSWILMRCSLYSHQVFFVFFIPVRCFWIPIRCCLYSFFPSGVVCILYFSQALFVFPSDVFVFFIPVRCCLYSH